MKTIKTRLISVLLVVLTLLSLLPTSALAATGTGKGITITTNQAYWSTRILANGTPYSYRPPEAAGRLLYCLDSGLGYTAIPDLRNKYHAGVELDCIVKVYDPEKDELVISVKEIETNPFLGAELRHPVGCRRLAVISGKYGGGVFCNLPDGVVCMCNYSYQHEDSDFMVGENVMLVVQRYDDEKLQVFGKIMSKW